MKINLPCLERATASLASAVPLRVNGVRPLPANRPPTRGRVRLALATEKDRETIYRLRHDVYARELAQHGENGEGRLCDALDDFNTYIVAKVGGEIVGF